MRLSPLMSISLAYWWAHLTVPEETLAEMKILYLPKAPSPGNAYSKYDWPKGYR